LRKETQRFRFVAGVGKIAILALNSLGNTEVATKLAGLYPSEGTVAALKVIAKSGQEAERNLANQALRGIFDRQRKAVVQVAVDDPELQPYASGALVSPSGYVITADYAVTAAPNLDQRHEKLRVITADGASHKATVVGIDETSGLAVLKITSSNSPVLQFGNPTVRPGDSVLAIGSRGSLALEPAAGVVKGIDNRFAEVTQPWRTARIKA
jgi:S1-C subfamily serine protease